MRMTYTVYNWYLMNRYLECSKEKEEIPQKKYYNPTPVPKVIQDEYGKITFG